MADSDTPNLSRPKLIPIPGLKPKQAEKPPEEPPVDESEASGKPPVDEQKSSDGPPPETERKDPPPPDPKPEKPISVTPAPMGTGSDTKSPKPEDDPEEHQRLKLKKIITPLYAKPDPAPPGSVSKTENKESTLEIPRAEPIMPEPEPVQAPPVSSPPVDEAVPPPPVESPEESSSGSGLSLAEKANLKIPEPEPPEEDHMEEEEEPVETLVKAPKKKTSRNPLFIPIGGLVVIALLVAAYFIFDPFGLKLEPIQPRSPIVQKLDKGGTEELIPRETLSMEDALFDLDSLNLDSFLAQLKDRSVQAIPNPEGIFIDDVFYAKGSQLHPQFGLVIQDIAISKSEVLITLQDGDSSLHEIPLQLQTP
jgi:hypothetical protein